MQIQFHFFLYFCSEVVICFKFSNFAYANTVAKKKEKEKKELLFALNLVILLMQIQ